MNIRRVQFEILQINQLVETYQDLLDRVMHESPDLVEVTALASVLHSFYTGVESIFTTIIKELDQNLPQGPRFHRELLRLVAEETDFRGAVIGADVAGRLTKYLGFRHYYRHSYSYKLEWDEMSELVYGMSDTWRLLQEDLLSFLSSYLDDEQ